MGIVEFYVSVTILSSNYIKIIIIKTELSLAAHPCCTYSGVSLALGTKKRKEKKWLNDFFNLDFNF